MKLALPLIPHRSCGGCTACCTVMPVSEINKPGDTPCQHLCAGGCAIYESRPSACRGWRCAWLEGLIPGDERRRPDKCGLIFAWFGWDNTKAFLVALEVWPGAAQEQAPLLRQLRTKMVSHAIVPIVVGKYGIGQNGQKQFLWPNELAQVAERCVKEGMPGSFSLRYKQ
jgi:hypothetical protein